MNERPSKFVIESTDTEKTPLQLRIDALYSRAREHSNEDALFQLFEDVTNFGQELLEAYGKPTLESIDEYHTLIRSGVPSNHTFADVEKRDEIVKKIEAFVEGYMERLEASADSEGRS
jgi:hypothetical protein